MAVSLQRRKQNSKGFELVFHEERLRNVERAQREEAVQVTVSHAHERFGNARMAGALGVDSPVASLFAGGALAGLDIDATPLAGEASFLHDQLSLALVGFDTGLLGPDASNAAVQDAMAQSAAPGESAMRAQLNRDGEAIDYDASHPAVRGMHSRGGSPLPAAVASRLGAAFGHDFSHVRIHTDASAAAAAEALNARAFAVGAEIWFGRGAYNPETSEGTAILAHELTHVVQADEGRLPAATGEGLSVSSPTDAAEREAYANERSIPAMLDMATPDLSPMAGSAEASGVSTQPAADHQNAPVVDGQGLDGAVMRQLDWKRKRQRPGILDVGMDPPGKAVGSLLSGDGLKFDARFGNQNAGGAIQGNIGGKDGNSFKATGQVSDGANRLGVQANVGENGVDIAANANVQVGGVNVAANLGPNGISGSASVDGLPVNGRVDVGSNGVSGQANVNAGPLKGNVNVGPNGVTGAANLNAGPVNANLNLGPNGVSGAANLNAGPLKVDAKLDKDGVKLDPKLDGKDPKGKDGKEEGKDGAGKGGKEDEKEEGKDGEKGGDTAKLGPDGKPLPGGDPKGPPGAAGGGGGGGETGLGLGVAGGPGEELLGGLANGLMGGAFGMGGPQAVARSLGTLRLPGFDLDKKEEEGLKKQTGMTPAQHQQAIQGHVERLRVQVDQMRAGLKRYAEDKALALDAELTAARDALTGDMGSARGKISGAYAGARAGLGTAAAEAMGTVTAAAAGAREKLATSLPAQQARLTALVAAGRTSVDGFGAPWKTKFGEELEVGAKAFDATAKLCAGELAATKAAIVNTWGDTGNALERAENEARRKAAGKGIDDAVRDFGAGGAQKAAAARAQKPTYDGQIDSALTTVRDTLTNLETTGRAQLIAANTRAGEQITTQSTEAQTAITGAKTRAEGALTTAETAALGEVDNVQAQQAQNLTSACESAKASILGADGSLQERYAQWFDGVLAGIPADQATTYEQVKEFLDGKERELPTFNASIMTELDGSCETARQTLVDAANNARTALTRLADGQAQSAANQGRQQADGLRATATQFANGILATGGAIETAFAQHIEPLSGSVTQKLTELEGQLTAALAAAKADLARQNTAYATQLRARIAAMPQTLTPMANAAAAGVYRDLSGRAQRVHSACKGMGTDESAVYNALRGLSAIGGAALEQVVWGRLFRAEGGLRAFLDDDLNDDEKRIAFAYLGGNTALGARLEIDSNMRWYGDDEAQIEKILRELSPEDLAAMQAQPQWAATRGRLMSNLGGTDLDVSRALLAGNVARADAYRLREKIDEARRSRDPDALADALAGVDPAQLAAVQQEFVNIQNKVDPEATNVPPIDPALAANQLADYATRDIQEGPRGRGGRPQTNSVTGANRDLVRALATEGRDSVSAATSRFEVERTRAGGPKMDRMEMALMAPAAIQEQLHSPDPQVRAQAEQQQNQREQAMRDQYTRQYGGASGATMDSAIGGMFSGRTDKEAQTSQRLMRNMLADGTNSPRVAADMIALGADGAGTDEAMIKRALNGMRPDEVRQMNTVYQQVHGGSVYERLGVAERDANGNKIAGRDHASNQWFNELSGDDRREVEMLLQGDERYMTSQQQLALARSQYDWQRGSESGGMGRAMMDGSAEQKDLDRNFNALTTLSARMRPDGTFANPTDQREYERLCGDVGINTAQYQAANDRTANYITTGVAIVGAVVVTAATFGSGAPAGAAMIMAATGTAASGAISMGVNAGMKGGRYGYEQAAVDAGVTLVNTATAGAGAYMKGVQVGVGTLGKVGAEVAIDTGMGFINGAAQTAMTDGTWDQGFVSGLGTTALGGGRQALTDAASSAVSTRIDESALGQTIEQSGSLWRTAVFKGSSNAAGAVATVAAGTAFDAARGKGPTDLGAVAEQAGTEGAKQFLMGAGGGALGAGIRRRNGQAAGAGPPAPNSGNDPHGPPPGSGSGPARDPNTPPNDGGGGTADVSVDPATPRVTDTTQRPVGGPPAGTTDRPPSTPSGTPDVDATTGRQPAGTQTDAAVVARQQQAHGGQGGRNDNDAHVVRNQDTGEATVTSARGVTRADDSGAATRNNDGTTEFADADGNRTLFLPDGGSRTILRDGTVVLRDADGTAVAVKDEVAIRLDAQGKPIAQPDTPAPRPTEATREQAVFDRVDQLLTNGKLSPDQAWTIVARSGDAAGQEAALRAAESRISQDDAVITRLVDLAKEKGPDGRPAIHPDELDAVIAAPDPLRALQVLDARQANRAQDAQVKQEVDAATRADEGGGRFVDEVFDNITVGAGFAGISNEISARGNGADGRRLVVGGENPWLRANADLGQRAGESEVVGGAQPMRGTADTANKPFMAARQHAENVEINRAGAGVGVLDGKVDGVELRSQMPPGTTWHKDAAARIRLNDGVNADGSPKFRYVYANHVDLAGGAGAARDLSTTPGRDGSGPQIDAALYAQMKADGRIMMSDQGFDGSRVAPGEKVLVYGGGASGAWGSEGASRNAAEVEWLGRMAQPSDDMPSSQRDRLVGLHDTLKSARASGDPVAIQRAMGDLERFTFTEGRGNGFLPRNQREGAAFDPAMQRENGGKITRSVTDDIRTVTFETNPANGKQQIRLVGKDGQEFWADRVVLAIGQDGEAGGGPGKLLGEIKGMTPLIDTSGRDYPFPVVVGVESADGAVRVIGAAATSPSVRKRIAEGFRETADESFALQSAHESVPTDSQGVVGSFHHAEKMIRAANRETLVRLAQADPATQQRILGAHDDAHDVKAAADERRLAHPPELPTMESTGRSRTGGATDAAVIPGAPRLVGPEPGQAVTTPREGDTPLIGLSGDFFDPKASGEQLRTQLTEGGVPRQQRLSESERAEETRFADWVQRNVGAASDGARKLAESIGNPDQPIFEVDAMKRLLPEYGSGGKPATPEERAYRLEMNHALHPTAVAIARLGFQERLDVLARLPDGHPSKQVFVTSGGCAAGKGDLTGIVQNAMGERAKFGAVWDAAGEGDAGENAWVLRAATERGIKVVFGYAEADPVTRYQSVLERAGLSGRVVDVMTFINSYSDGAAAFKSFLDSPEYRTAVAEGRAEAFGIAPGEFNRGSLTDKSQKAYPDVKPLNQADQTFGAQHVGDPPNKQQALEASLRILEDHVRKERDAGRNPDAVARGALENAIKFLDGQPAAVRVAVLESYQRIFGGAPQ